MRTRDLKSILVAFSNVVCRCDRSVLPNQSAGPRHLLDQFVHEYD